MVVRSVQDRTPASPARAARAARGQPLAEHHNTPDETAGATPARHSRDGLKRRTVSDLVLGCALQLRNQPLPSISPHQGAPWQKNLGSFHRWQPPGHPGQSGLVATHVSRFRCAAHFNATFLDAQHLASGPLTTALLYFPPDSHTKPHRNPSLCWSAWVVAPHISLPLVRRCFPPLRLAIWALFSDEMDVMAAASPDSRRLAPLSHRHWFRRARQTGTGATVQPDEMPRQCQSRPPTSAATHQQGCSRVSGRQADARRAVSTPPPFLFPSLQRLPRCRFSPTSPKGRARLWPRLCLQGRPLAVSCA